MNTYIEGISVKGLLKTRYHYMSAKFIVFHCIYSKPKFFLSLNYPIMISFYKIMQIILDINSHTHYS